MEKTIYNQLGTQTNIIYNQLGTQTNTLHSHKTKNVTPPELNMCMLLNTHNKSRK